MLQSMRLWLIRAGIESHGPRLTRLLGGLVGLMMTRLQSMFPVVSMRWMWRSLRLLPFENSARMPCMCASAGVPCPF